MNSTKLFIETFYFLQKFNCLEAIDEMFLKLINEDWNKETVEVNISLIIVFLRTNYSIRDNLKYYKKMMKKSVNYLEKNSIDPKKILLGII